MATITASPTGGTRNWNDTATWVGGVVPGAGDDVLLTATSGAVTINNAANTCLTLDCTGYTSTLTHNAAITFAVAGTVFKLVAGMTYTLGNAATSAVAFTKTSAGTVLITTGGKVLGNVFTSVASASSATYQLQDNCAATGGTWTHTAGALDTNGKSFTAAAFSSSGTNTRTITLGASSLTFTGAQPWTTTATGMTFTPGTSTINCNDSVSFAFAPGGLTFNSVVLSSGGTISVTGANTYATLTVAAGSLTTTAAVALFANQTVTGTLTLNGNSISKRLLVQSNSIGTSRTITAGALVATNVIDFQDITGAGAATWTTAASGATAFGDCLGNSGITFTTPTTLFGALVLGNWSSTITWSLSSGGAHASQLPLPQDTVILDANSGATSGSLTADMPRLCKDLTCTGFTKTLSQTVAPSIFGSCTLGSGMTLTAQMTFAGRGSHTLTSAGKSWTNAISLSAPGGTYTLQDDFATTSSMNFTAGTLVANSFNVTASSYVRSGTLATALTMGSGTWTATGSGTVWNFAAAGTTITPGTSTIALSDVSSTAKTFAGAGLTYGNLSITGGGTGTVTFTGANTFATLTIGAPKTVIFPASTTTTITTLVTPGPSGNVLTSQSSIGGTKATVTTGQNQNLPAADWMALTDLAFTNIFYAGSNSTAATSTGVQLSGRPGVLGQVA